MKKFQDVAGRIVAVFMSSALAIVGGSALIATYMGIGFVLGAARRDPVIYKGLQETGIKWLR